MGKKIKSALELALEKTEAFRELPGKSPEQEYEPYFKASALLADSFLKMQSAPEKVFDAISGYPEGAREKAVRIFLEKITVGMELPHCPAAAAAYRLFGAVRESGLLEKLEELERKYRDDIRETQARVEDGQCREEQLLAPLRQDGISGSALDGVNLERSPWWQQKLNLLAQGHHSQLALLKEQLLAAIKK